MKVRGWRKTIPSASLSPIPRFCSGEIGKIYRSISKKPPFALLQKGRVCYVAD